MAAIVLKNKEEIDAYALKLNSGEIRNVAEVLTNELFIVSALGDNFLVVGSNDYNNASLAVREKLGTSSVVIDSVVGEKAEVGENEIEILNQGINPEEAAKVEKNFSDGEEKESSEQQDDKYNWQKRADEKNKQNESTIFGMSISKMLNI